MEQAGGPYFRAMYQQPLHGDTERCGRLLFPLLPAVVAAVKRPFCWK